MSKQPVDNLEGKRLNENYRVSKVIHWSEHSVICLAEQLDTKKTVKLTILEDASIKNREHFDAVCKKTTKLQHNGLSLLYDLGKTTDGEPFLCSELSDLTLTELLHRGETYELGAATQMITSIIDSLVYLERRGERIILPLPHRIFLQKKAEKISASSRANSKSGMTLPYSAKMAAWCNVLDFIPEDSLFSALPSELEQLKHQPPESLRLERLDSRSQVYTLACIFYQLIAGRPPFNSDDLVDLQSQQLCSPPPRLHEARPDLYFDPKLEKVLLKALAKDPSQRYRDLLEFRSAIQQFLSSNKAKLYKTYSNVCLAALILLVGWVAYSSLEPAKMLMQPVPVHPDPFGERPDDLLPSPVPASTQDALSSLPAIPADAVNLGTISESMQLKAGNYYCQKIYLDASKQLKATGDVKLWIKPAPMQDSVCTLKESASIESAPDSGNFIIYYVSQANIMLSGKSKLECKLIAPAAAIEASGEALISGDVTSNGQILKEKAHFLHINQDE